MKFLLLVVSLCCCARNRKHKNGKVVELVFVHCLAIVINTDESWSVFDGRADVYVSSYREDNSPENAFDENTQSFWISDSKEAAMKVVFDSPQIINAILLRKWEKWEKKDYGYSNVCVEVLQAKKCTESFHGAPYQLNSEITTKEKLLRFWLRFPFDGKYTDQVIITIDNGKKARLSEVAFQFGCSKGFEAFEYGDLGQIECIDIDECITDVHNCHHNVKGNEILDINLLFT